VFFMQGGFAMLEAGAVQRSLKLNILFKNMIDSSIIALLFWAVGYGLAFGEPSTAFSGLGEFFLIGTSSRRYAYVFFQYSFTTTTATILSGGAAGRLRIGCYMIYCVFMGAIMHPLVIHWIWASSGWLNAYGRNAFLGVGLADFAGGVAVHVNGGAATLVAVWLGGYRNQQSNDPANPPRYEPIGNGKWRSNVLPADSVSESTHGVFILWFGFFAFNMGSFVTFAGRGDLVGLVGINSALCSAGAALGAVFFSQILQRIRVRAGRLAKVNPWQMDDVLNGTLVGLVAATSNCSLVNTWAAVVIGIFAGLGKTVVSFFLSAHCFARHCVRAVDDVHGGVSAGRSRAGSGGASGRRRVRVARLGALCRT
jgi:Amt family ammonium transporter